MTEIHTSRDLSFTIFGILLLGGIAMAAEPPLPGKTWPTAAPADVGLDENLLARARDYALAGRGSGCIIRNGRWIMGWGDPAQRYDIKSSTKSVGVTALGLAIADGKVTLQDKAFRHHPSLGVPPQENSATGWIGEITLLHLATQTAGFEKPGGYGKLLFAPGTKWHYSDAGPNWLAECLTLLYRRDMNDLLFERVFAPIGITPADLRWRPNAYRPHEIEGLPRREFGSGIHANVNAMARIGLLYLRQGRWGDRQIVPREFVEMARRAREWMEGLPVVDAQRYPGASSHYGLLWWNNNDGTLPGAPRDAYWSWGLFDSLIVVIPSLDLVIARAGPEGWKGDFSSHYGRLAPFLEPIVAAVKGPASAAATSRPGPPCPPSPVIRRLVWAPAKTIIRQGEGSDNWPMTWADDGHQYTAYGDGWGFEPKVKGKLSMGFARVEGSPEDFRGINIRTTTGEQVGDGASGRKASGILCVKGRLYLWARNAGNSQLTWSDDHGRTWTWSDWRFTTSFGCPTFLNFGRDYAGARDEHVYVYSFDSDTAYTPADRMVLARVHQDRIAQRDAYEFFVRLDERGQPVWSRDIERRGAVFGHPGRCYRSGISYNPGLKRYIWWQVIPDGDTRKEGGFGVYDAPEPWGPWTAVHFTPRWDVGPGESGSFPTKWMSRDGRTMHLVCSGDDCFTVRKATLEIAAPVTRPAK